MTAKEIYPGEFLATHDGLLVYVKDYPNKEGLVRTISGSDPDGDDYMMFHYSDLREAVEDDYLRAGYEKPARKAP